MGTRGREGNPFRDLDGTAVREAFLHELQYSKIVYLEGCEIMPIRWFSWTQASCTRSACSRPPVARSRGGRRTAV
eukprot:6814302-Pyramimonas_sp.AAC.1